MRNGETHANIRGGMPHVPEGGLEEFIVLFIPPECGEKLHGRGFDCIGRSPQQFASSPGHHSPQLNTTHDFRKQQIKDTSLALQSKSMESSGRPLT